MTSCAVKDTPTVTAKFPAKLQFLFQPSRYKVLVGGRGGAKSWGISRALLLQATQQPLRILCAREIQSSIKDSVHALLSEQISMLGLSDRFQILENEIRGINGTRISFEGLRFNARKIKSYEGVDRVWVEEADAVTRSSWDILIPTIRKDGSEIWISFNPELDEDYTYQQFVVAPPASAVVQKINWEDNPWFPEVLRQEKDALKEKDYDAYLHVWEGHTRQSIEGAVYAQEMRLCRKENRITRVPYNPSKPVFTFWDLGHADHTAIWFIQQDAPGTFRVIDFYANRLQKIAHYIAVLQQKMYVYSTDYLPHDGANETLQSKSIQRIMEGFSRKVEVVPQVPTITGLNAVREVFPLLWFDEEKCADGLSYLRRYRYKLSPDGRFSNEPLHDNTSHAADALKTFALGWTEPRKQKKKQQAAGSWLTQ